MTDFFKKTSSDMHMRSNINRNLFHLTTRTDTSDVTRSTHMESKSTYRTHLHRLKSASNNKVVLPLNEITRHSRREFDITNLITNK